MQRDLDERRETVTPDPEACAQRWRNLLALGNGLEEQSNNVFAGLSDELKDEYKSMDDLALDMPTRLDACYLNLDECTFVLRDANGTQLRTVSGEVTTRSRLVSMRPATRPRIAYKLLRDNEVKKINCLQTMRVLAGKLNLGGRKRVANTLLEAYSNDLLDEELWETLFRCERHEIPLVRFKDPVCAWMMLKMAVATGATPLYCTAFVDASVRPEQPAESFAVIQAMCATLGFEDIAAAYLETSLRATPGVSSLPYTIFRHCVSWTKWFEYFNRWSATPNDNLMLCWLYNIFGELSTRYSAEFMPEQWHRALLENPEFLTAFFQHCVGSPLFSHVESAFELMNAIAMSNCSPEKCVTALRLLAGCKDIGYLLLSSLEYNPALHRREIRAFALRYYAARVGLINASSHTAQRMVYLVRLHAASNNPYIDDSCYTLFKAILEDRAELTHNGRMVLDALQPVLPRTERHIQRMAHLQTKAIAEDVDFPVMNTGTRDPDGDDNELLLSAMSNMALHRAARTPSVVAPTAGARPHSRDARPPSRDPSGRNVYRVIG